MGQVDTPLGCTRPSSWGWVGSMMPGAEAGGGCHRGTAWLQVELRLGGGVLGAHPSILPCLLALAADPDTPAPSLLYHH